MSRGKQFDVCIRALEQAGCGVAFEGANAVRIRFPPNPNDPHAAPDGEERTYPRPYFTLLVTRLFMELVEQHMIDDEGKAL